MTHIDEQISQIYNFLSPLHSSNINNPSPVSDTTQPPSVPSQSSPFPPTSLMTTTTSLEMNTNKISPTYEMDASFMDANLTPPTRQITDYESTVINIPPPPSVYNRSASSSIVSLGLPATPRGSVSNKIVPAPSSPKQPSNTSFRPISNTRFNPGRSPKPKTRSHHHRPSTKHQQQSEKSTIIELESSTNQNESLLSSSKSGSDIFRRYTDQTGTSPSSTLLYPPTSDDEHPISPTSSGNEDDDCRPLTSSSNKHHHQTPL